MPCTAVNSGYICNLVFTGAGVFKCKHTGVHAYERVDEYVNEKKDVETVGSDCLRLVNIPQ